MNLDGLITAYHTLRVDNLEELLSLYHEEALFRDPFNRLCGRGQIRELFLDMFARLEHPRFHIIDHQQSGSLAWLSWRFEFHLAGKPCELEGCTRLTFAEDGSVKEHRDYWDSGDLFLHLPLVGTIVRWLRRRLAVSANMGKGGLRDE